MPNRRELGYVSAGSTSTIPATTGYGVATGGSSSDPITVSSENYTLLTFTSDDNLVVSSGGLFDVVVDCSHQQSICLPQLMLSKLVRVVVLVVLV
jgi:hypothetical protein